MSVNKRRRKVGGMVWQTLAAIIRLWYTDRYEWAQFLALCICQYPPYLFDGVKEKS